VRDLALSERGERLRTTEPSLPEILDDHATLRRTPKGSLAHAYCDFMEAEGLSAAGLVAEAERPAARNIPIWSNGSSTARAIRMICSTC
jgi:ubiquinone biosynthesis protein COQ4